MFQKRYFATSSAAFVYIILISLLFMFNEKRQTCNNNGGCVRFCCKNLETCKDQFIRKNFNSSYLFDLDQNETGANETWAGTQYNILYDKPSCSLDLIGSAGNWTFDVVRLEYLINFTFHNTYTIFWRMDQLLMTESAMK